jgi:hypothetical protein
VHGSRGATLALRDGERGLLVKCFAGCDARDVFAELRCRGLLGDAPHDRCHRPARAIIPPDNRNDAVHRIALARRIWNAARDARGSPVVRYFAGRSITINLPPVLRWAPSLRRLDGGHSPGIVGRVDDVDGQLVGVHRTWLVCDATGIWRRHGRATRERRPAGTEAADLENTTGNGNIPANSAPRLSLQARRSAELRRQRRMRMAVAAWKLGPRAFFEFIDELDRHFDVPDLDRRLGRYANADPQLVALLGGDRLPPIPPPRLVGGRQ